MSEIPDATVACPAHSKKAHQDGRSDSGCAVPIIPGGGEMGQRVRAFDWASTPLGPTDEWPQSLQVAAGICLNSRFPMFVWWGPGRINIYNDAYIPVLGKRHPQALGRRAQEIWQEIWPVIGPQADAVTLRGEATWNDRVLLVMERNNFTEDTWFTWSYSPIPDEKGGIGGLFCACTEETHRVLAERKRDEFELALASSERRFKFLSDLGESTSNLTDPEQIMAVVARALGQNLGVSRCAYADVEPDSERFTIRHDYTDGCASSTGDYHLSLFGPRAAEKQRGGQTLIINDVDVELAPDEGADTFNSIGVKAIICCPLVKSNRLAATMAVHQTTPRRWTPDEIALVEAVVERSWAYIERARAVRSVADSERRLRAVVEATPECVKIVAPDGFLSFMNAAGIGMVEADGGPSIVGGCVFDLVAPEYREQWIANHHRVCGGERLTWDFEIIGLRGARRWMETHAVPLTLPDGRVAQLAVTRDVTGRKNIEKERESLLQSERHARSEAERNSRMKDEFLATLSHELRTPLNAIVGWSQILRGGNATLEDFEEGLSAIDRNAKAQTQIIEDLLDMSRIISGKVRLDVQRIDLSAVVQAAVDTMKPAADAKSVRLQALIDPKVGPVTGDPGRLHQVFWNLLSNAIKFTPKGGRVQVLVEPVNSHLEVSIVDTGEGIAAEFLPHVFDRFRQADSSTTRRHGGLGLGLSIVKQLVELHGGTVKVKSAGVGQGTRFSVMLPLSVVHPETSEPERRHPGGASMAFHEEACAQLTGARVLVVDDEADALAVVRRLLEDCGAVVQTAESADAAMSMIVEGSRYDVLVSDIGMPGEDGYSLIKRVRSLPKGKGGEVPALALTAYARAEDRVRAVRAGYQMHVVKPVDPAELITMVASLAGQSKQLFT